MTFCIPKKRPKKRIDTIIVHIHGGGFIALSSFSSQYYTRKWANALNIPIFSIDYRKPP
jgi:hormone-sensitive lipase